MKTKTQKELEKQLMNQMGIDDEKELLHWEKEPYLMDNQTVITFWEYVKKSPAITIVGDYDVDGVCASYIMAKAIRHLYPQKPISIRIPKRMSEGYGINPIITGEIEKKLPKGGLVITVDNGIAAAKTLEDLKEKDYKVIVTDHHELGKNTIPKVDMVINPKVPLKQLIFNGDYWCGAAVAYKLAESMVSEDLAKELEVFATIATISDCMSLREGNWGLVKRGMQTIKEQKAPKSVLNLLEVLKQQPDNLSETSISFYLGPAINAPGRLIDDGAKIALDYFLNPTNEKCLKLVGLNEERRTLRDEQLEQLKVIIKEQHLENDCPIWVAGHDLHEGIVGILAGNLAEEYGVPVIVLTESTKDPSILKGSARSAGDINIFEYLQSCGDIFQGFGGHAGAAGLSIPKENLEIARSHQLEKPHITEYTNNILLSIRKDEIPDMAEISEYFRPFGEGNNPPIFTVDVNLEKDPNKMLGKPPIHLCVTDPLRKYKILHFYHEPNELKKKYNFNLTGEIKYETFRGNQTAVLFADKIEEPEEDENGLELDV